MSDLLGLLVEFFGIEACTIGGVSITLAMIMAGGLVVGLCVAVWKWLSRDSGSKIGSDGLWK